MMRLDLPESLERVLSQDAHAHPNDVSEVAFGRWGRDSVHPQAQ